MTDTVETEEEYEPDYTYPVGKAPTALQKRFAEWLQSDAVGYNPAAAKSKVEAFEEGVRLGVALRIPYQASEHNKTATAEEREARAIERAEREAAKEAERKAKAAQAAQVAPVEEAPAAKPAKATKTTKAKATPAATPATAPAASRPAARRAPARRAPATANAGDAPF